MVLMLFNVVMALTCTDKIVASTKQVADSIQINVISACVFVNLVCSASEAVIGMVGTLTFQVLGIRDI